MRRFAFLAILLVLFAGVVTPTHATPRNQEWVEHPSRGERDAGASGDDDVPSKQEQARQVEIPSTDLSVVAHDKIGTPLSSHRIRALWGQCVRYVWHKVILVNR